MAQLLMLVKLSFKKIELNIQGNYSRNLSVAQEVDFGGLWGSQSQRVYANGTTKTGCRKKKATTIFLPSSLI